jgi:hypothetical protein
VWYRSGALVTGSAAVSGHVTATAPRLDPRLVAATFALDDHAESIAETWRRVGSTAERLGVPRPGYDTIRLLVHVHRARRDEIRRLLEPVVIDLLRGYVSPRDHDRVLAAAEIAAADRRTGRRRPAASPIDV